MSKVGIALCTIQAPTSTIRSAPTLFHGEFFSQGLSAGLDLISAHAVSADANSGKEQKLPAWNCSEVVKSPGRTEGHMLGKKSMSQDLKHQITASQSFSFAVFQVIVDAVTLALSSPFKGANTSSGVTTVARSLTLTVLDLRTNTSRLASVVIPKKEDAKESCQRHFPFKHIQSKPYQNCSIKVQTVCFVQYYVAFFLAFQTPKLFKAGTCS